MDIRADLTVAREEAEKLAADLHAAAQDAKTAKSWLALNYHYAIAIAAGALVLGLALGMKVGEHLK